MKSRYQRGVTLIEVLVSMFLLGIAVIGFVALQLRSVTATGESMYRAQAMSIAQDVSEKMRANAPQLAAYRAANWTAPPITDCYNAVCTQQQMVNFDIIVARQAVAASLPNGNIAARQCGGHNNTCIYVSWGNTTTASDGSANACATPTGSYVSGVIPECVMLEVY